MSSGLKYSWGGFLAAGLLALTIVGRALAQDTQDTQASRQPTGAASPLVVLRISSTILTTFLDKRIDRQIPVNDVILGTPVSGVSRIVAQPQVKLEPCDGEAKFRVTFTGSIASRTVGRNAWVSIYGRAVTHFSATKEICFEPGRGFYASPPEVRTRTQCFTDSIAPHRGGIAGRIIERRAWGEVLSQQPQVTAISRQRATARIAAAFDRHMGERLAQLNRLVDIRTRLAGLRSEPDSATVVCRTTADYIELANAGGTEDGPGALPRRATDSPVELWIHQSVVPEPVAEAVRRYHENPTHSAMVKLLTILPAALGSEPAATVVAFLNDWRLGSESIGNWLVIEADPQPTNLASSGTPLRR